MFVNHVHLMPEWLRPDGTLDALRAVMDAVGFAGAVCYAPFRRQMNGRDEDPNRWLTQTIRGHDELVGFGTLDETRPPAEQVGRIAELGLVGVKLHPPYQRLDLAGPWMAAACEAMAEHRLIADFHTGMHFAPLRPNALLAFDELAFRFPELAMIFEHVGGWHFHREMIAVISNHRQAGRLYAGIASVLDRDGDDRHWYLGPEGLNDCRWQLGADQLIYGLDFPYNQRPRFESDLRIIRDLGWPAEDTAKLLGGNLRRLLGRE